MIGGFKISTNTKTDKKKSGHIGADTETKKPKKRAYDESAIVSLTRDKDRVHKKPTIFIPNVDKEGALHVVEEIVDNAIDENNNSDMKNPTGTCIIEKVKKNLIVTVIDNGRGIPLGRAVEIFTVLSTSGKFNNTDADSANKQTGGTNGYGTKLANFLSCYLNCDIYRDGTHLELKFVEGELISQTKKKADTTKKHGTTINFMIDPQHIPGIEDLDPMEIKNLIKDKSYIFPHVKMNFILIDKGKEVVNKSYYGRDISDLMAKRPIDTPAIRVTGKQTVEVIDNKLKEVKAVTVPMDLVFAFSNEAIGSDPLDFNKTYVNTINTTKGGKHLDGLRAGIEKFFRKELPNHLSKSEQELNITSGDMCAALTSVIWVGTDDPIFRGQFKDTTYNDEFRLAIRDQVYEALKQQSSATIKKMAKIIIRIAAGREMSKGTKKKSVDNAFSKDAINKYFPILRSIKTTRPEILLVEGDSAQDPTLQARDKYNQAIYAMMGKPPNVYDMAPHQLVHVQSVINDLIDIFGCGVGKNFDISKMPFDKIVIQTDADIDGDSMFISLLSFFYRFMRPLVTHGFIYRNIPPLYKFYDKGKEMYVTSQKEFFKHLNKKFLKKYTLKRGKDEMSEELVLSTLAINFDYASQLEDVAKRINCPPIFTEKLINTYSTRTRYLPLKKQLEVIKKEFKEHKLLNIKIEDDVICIEGTSDHDEYIFIMLNSDFLRRIRKIQQMQARSIVVYGYSIDDKKDLSLYEFMKIFEKEMPSDITRYKGFGEINPDKIQSICIDQDNRTLIRIKSNDIEKELELLNKINSSKKHWREARQSMIMDMDLRDITIDT